MNSVIEKDISLVLEKVSDSKQKHLAELIDRYNKRTRTSKQFAQNYRRVLADPKQSEWFNFATKEMCYLLVGERSQGSRVWDIDGNEYIDIFMSFGANLLGHNPPFIKAALQAQLEKGVQLGPQAEFAGEVAELICELTGMERVAFSNTGTEAVMTAIRLARAATKRSKIAVFADSYHGHFDGVLVKPRNLLSLFSNPGQPPANNDRTPNNQQKKLPDWLEKFVFRIMKTNFGSQALPLARGLPPNIAKDVLVLNYGDPKSLKILHTHRHQLAAVLVEPIQSAQPDVQPKEFLKQLKQLTQKAGIALIFDEMVTGFRLHLGGAQAWFGVEADIATYGKVVGGGMPIGIIAGKARYLDKLDGGFWEYGNDSYPQTERTFFAGTHCKHPLSMAAARAMLQYLKHQGPTLQQQLNQRTADYVKRLNVYFEASQLPIRMAHFGSFFGPVFPKDAVPSEILPFMGGLNLLRYHLFDKGILLRGEGGGFFSTAHTDDDVDCIIQAMKDSISELKEAKIFPDSVC